MFIRTPADLGAAIRDRRKQLGFDQSTFARRIGVSRQWVIRVERGHARAAMGLVLRAVDALGIRLDASTESYVWRALPRRAGFMVSLCAQNLVNVRRAQTMR